MNALWVLPDVALFALGGVATLAAIIHDTPSAEQSCALSFTGPCISAFALGCIVLVCSRCSFRTVRPLIPPGIAPTTAVDVVMVDMQLETQEDGNQPNDMGRDRVTLFCTLGWVASVAAILMAYLVVYVSYDLSLTPSRCTAMSGGEFQLIVSILWLFRLLYITVASFRKVSDACCICPCPARMDRNRDVLSPPPPIINLTKEEFDLIPDCAICLDKLLQNDSIKRLPRCGHVFHIVCVERWLRLRDSCPLCQSSVLINIPAN